MATPEPARRADSAAGKTTMWTSRLIQTPYVICRVDTPLPRRVDSAAGGQSRPHVQLTGGRLRMRNLIVFRLAVAPVGAAVCGRSVPTSS
jgi:hypothetical protein